MIFPVWHFDYYGLAVIALQTHDEVSTAEAVVEASGTRPAPVGRNNDPRTATKEADYMAAVIPASSDRKARQGAS